MNGILPWDAVNYLTSDNEIAEYLAAAFETGQLDDVTHALSTVLRARGRDVSRLALQGGRRRRQPDAGDDCRASHHAERDPQHQAQGARRGFARLGTSREELSGSTVAGGGRLLEANQNAQQESSETRAIRKSIHSPNRTVGAFP